MLNIYHLRLVAIPEDPIAMYDDNLTHTDIQYSTPVDLEALDAKPDTS
jgi:hypothetical protein